MTAVFFADQAAFRDWLASNGANASELLMGMYKIGSSRPSITWQQAVDEALCAGWIDGVRHRIDDETYSIRFTPRRRGSIWSAVNLARVAELTRQGRMLPAGLAAFERRTDARSAIYSYEQRQTAEFDPEALRKFQASPEAWAFFQSAAPSYRRTATFWVVSAKRAETRRRRLDTLIADSTAGRRIKPLSYG